MINAKKMTGLEKLIDAVKLGQFSRADFDLCVETLPKDLFSAHNVVQVMLNNSMDAAKKLHEAVLPGWTVNNSHKVRQTDNGKPHNLQWECMIVRYSPTIERVSAQSYSPASAWLLCILKAYMLHLVQNAPKEENI